MHNNRAKLGILVTLSRPTSAMERAAREAESVDAGGKFRPRVQIRTIEELLKGNKPSLPPVYDIISAAAAARRGQGKRMPKTPTPEEIRKAPSFKLPISGGRAKDAQKDLPLGEPLLAPEQSNRPKRAKR